MNEWQTTEMGNSKLILHCGGQNVSRAKLLTIPTPPRTKSWVPVPHFDLVTEIGDTLSRTGLVVTSEAYGINREGNQFFGLLGLGGEVLRGSDDYQVVAGIRNSHDKSFPVGLVVGARVFVCDNLSFSSEIQITRRHTSRLTDDLPRLVATAVGQIADSAERQQARFDHYKTVELSEMQAHDLMVQSIDVGATSGRRRAGCCRRCLTSGATRPTTSSARAGRPRGGCSMPSQRRSRIIKWRGCLAGRSRCKGYSTCIRNFH